MFYKYLHLKVLFGQNFCFGLGYLKNLKRDIYIEPTKRNNQKLKITKTKFDSFKVAENNLNPINLSSQ